MRQAMEQYRQTFQSPYEQYRHRNGETFTPVSTITEPDATHDAEVLPMHVIRFRDGEQVEAWPEEVLEREG